MATEAKEHDEATVEAVALAIKACTDKFGSPTNTIYIRQNGGSWRATRSLRELLWTLCETGRIEMKLNRYVRNGFIRRSPPGSMVQLVECYGDAVSDPRVKEISYGSIDGWPVPAWYPGLKLGRPEEMIFHIAGKTYYPTSRGYEIF